MISFQQFSSSRAVRKIDFFCGVPCSYLTPFFQFGGNATKARYLSLANEGDAVACAAGAWLAGKNACALFQNSGLGNAVNVLTSLNNPFAIPVLLMISWRGQPGIVDEPQHELMGEITCDLLEKMRIRYTNFPEFENEIEPKVGKALQCLKNREPYAFIVPKNGLRTEKVQHAPTRKFRAGERLAFPHQERSASRIEIIEALLSLKKSSDAIIATTGKTGRELYTAQDCCQHFYMVGSMGCASSIGLGVALNTSSNRVIVLDGDGATLMRMGALATIGFEQPQNLVHVLLDNGAHDSTGGQPTVSEALDFPSIALSCGYEQVYSCNSVRDFEAVFESLSKKPGLSFVHVKIRPGSISKLGRPNIHPKEVAIRFKEYLDG